MMECSTGLLVDIDGETAPDTPPTHDVNLLPTSEDVTTTLTPPSLSHPLNVEEPLPKAKVKLCGYLNKISSTGIIKSSKSRWFSYNPDCCALTFYRSPDMEAGNNPPLGSVELRRASFNFTAEHLRDNIFTVTSGGSTHLLQACDRKTLLWWLQELQAERRAFNLHNKEDAAVEPQWHGTLLGQSLFWVPNSSNTNPGLVDVRPEGKAPPPVDSSHLDLGILPHIETPPDSVGDKALKPRSATMMSSSSLSTLSNKLAAFSNAGEAAIKGIKSQANKLKPPNFPRRMSDQSLDELPNKSISAPSSPGNGSSSGMELTYSSYLSGMKEMVERKREENELLHSKLRSTEETVQLLKMELEKYEKIKEMQSKQLTFSEEDYKLRSEVIGLKLAVERLEEEKERGRCREEELRERLGLLEEMVQVKDQIVIQLTNQIFDLENSLKELQSSFDKLKGEKDEEFVILSSVNDAKDTRELKDRAEGFMLQNKFLNNEILELANLRQIDSRRMQELQDKVHLQEAEHCQLHSKYLVLLSEMNKPRTESVGLAVGGSKVGSSDADRKEMVKLLIKDALIDSDAVTEATEHTRQRRYDQYGFSNVPEDDAELTLLSAASSLEKRSTDILQSLHQFNTSVAIKWQNYLTFNKELQRGDELKALIRLGVPHELRPQVWSWLVKLRTHHLRDPESGYYQRLVRSKEAQLPSKQIELDLLRTLPHNKHFASLSSSGIDQLRRVLRAYSIRNPTIGYCQGLNRVAAVALLYLCEEDAFWCLVAIVEDIMPPDYYSTTLTASQADQRVFRDLMAEKLPRLHRHLDAAGVDSSLITFNWLLCAYCDNVPPDTMLHIWDCLLNEGSKVLFRFGLAFFKHVEDEILQLQDYIAIFNFLRIMSHRMHDVRELTQLAFVGMNPFPMKKVTRLRQLHLEKVRAELQELDRIRNGFVNVRRNAERRGMESDED